MPMNLGAPRRIYVLPRQKIVWVRIAKSGFTTVLQLLSRLSGNRTSPSEASGYPEWSPESTIHDPMVHGLSRLEQLSARDRKAALTEPGWWRFAVVRAPHGRLLSAWTDKVFLRAPGTPHVWSGDDDDVLTGDGHIDVTRTFGNFVARLERAPDRFLCDPHFATQVSLLARDLFPELDIIPLSQLSLIRRRLDDLGHHVPEVPRLNESLHFDPRRVYDPATHSAVARLYREDLAFDPLHDAHDAAVGEPLVLSKLETECVYRLRSASRRIRQLSRLAVLPRMTVWLQRRLGLR
jgi:hypothetical protein